jgi:hypothetical protein
MNLRPVASVAFVVALAWSAGVWACNVPVFRYALERWRNDLYHVVVFHKGGLSADDRKRVDDIGRRSTIEGGTANLEVTTVDVADEFEPGFEELWKTVPQDAALPFVLVQARMGRDRTLTVWEGPLPGINLDQLTHSRDRQEIVDRLVKGHSAVWVVLPGRDELATHNTVNLIETELNRLQDELPLPEGIGQPGSEVYSEIPLTLKFSVLVLKPGPEADSLLPEMMRRIAPGAAAEGQPLVAPVFGRGRAVDVIPGDKVDEGTVEDLSRFICGACSCQVKEQNPGFDLLMSVPWNEKLFAPNMLPPKDEPKNEKGAELLAIAPGPAASDATSKPADDSTAKPSPPPAAPPAAAAGRSRTESSSIEMPWTRAWLISAGVIAVLFGWAVRPGRH